MGQSVLVHARAVASAGKIRTPPRFDEDSADAAFPYDSNELMAWQGFAGPIETPARRLEEKNLDTDH